MGYLEEEEKGEEEETEIMSAALLAHSNAISVLRVPLLYIMEPRMPLEIHASTASS